VSGPQRSSNVDLLTLAIAAAASAVAAYVTSLVWPDGTLISAAMTPVIVALVKEGLARPAERIGTLRTERRTGEHERAPRVEEAPTGTGPMTVHRSRAPARRWKIAIVTGLAAFVVVVALFTIPELVTGESIGGGPNRATTFFGGKERKADRTREERRTPKGDRENPAATAKPDRAKKAYPAPADTPKATATPTATPTPTPTRSPTPTPTATPSPSPTP